MTRNMRPVDLVQILAGVRHVNVVGLVSRDSQLPVISCPQHVDSARNGRLGESTQTGEQVNRFHFFLLTVFSVLLSRQSSTLRKPDTTTLCSAGGRNDTAIDRGADNARLPTLPRDRENS